MNHIFLTLLFLMSSVAHAQLQEYERRLNCGETQFVMSALIKTAQEKPIWSGADPQTGTQTSILVNTKTLTWTVVQYDHKMACVLQSGEGFRVLNEVLRTPSGSIEYLHRTTMYIVVCQRNRCHTTLVSLTWQTK